MLLLIDGNALLHRTFHALPPTIVTSAGELVNAVFGFTNAVINLIDKHKPSYVICTFDSPAKTFRHESFAEYKATRQAPAPGLYEQLPRVLAMLSALGICSIAFPGFESDDLIGTFSLQAENIQIPSLIVSSDNDFIQLVSPLTTFLCTAKGFSRAELMTPDMVVAKHGLTPYQWLDYKALRGDPSDNLPGIPGVGEKTAKQLLQTWNNLENIYLHIDDIPSKSLRLKLSENFDKAEMTKNLAQINRHVPVALTMKDLAYQGPNNKVMYNLCVELEFHQLQKRFKAPDSLFDEG